MYDDLYKLLACFNATLFIDGNQLEITDHGRASGTDMHSGAAEPGSKGQMGWLDPSRREKVTKSIHSLSPKDFPQCSLTNKHLVGL
jgi:hypothetical protein